MPLITQAIPNFVQGVSQQPPAQRVSGQVESQINLYSDPVTGLRKRPPVSFGKKLATESSTANLTVGTETAKIIKNDSDGKYAMVITDDTLKVHNLDTGLAANIRTNDGTLHTGGLAIATTDYLRTTNYDSNINFLTVSDTTYLTNKTKTVEVKTNATEADPNPTAVNPYLSDSASDEALIFVKQGAVNTSYGVHINHNQPVSGDIGERADIDFTWNTEYGGGGQIQNNGVGVINDGGSGYDATKELKITLNTKNGNYTYSSSAGQITWSTNANGTITYIKLNTVGITYRVTNIKVQLYNDGVYGQFPKPNDPNYSTTRIDAEHTSAHAGTIDNDYRGTTGNYGVHLSATATNKIAHELHELLIAEVEILAFGSTDLTTTRFNVERRNNIIRLKPSANVGSDFLFGITTEDGLANNGLGVLYKQVNSITDLPLTCFNNFKIKVSGDESAVDDYYVKFITNNNEDFGDGYWEETVGYDVATDIDAETFPHQLQLTVKGTALAADEFYFGPLYLESRLAGTDFSNPLPSFVNRQIENLFFFKNRLGVLTEDKVIMSEYGLGPKKGNILYYNYFRTTVQTLLPTAVIDITVATNRVTNLKSTALFQDKLILFSENTQFVLQGEQELTAQTVSVVPVTTYDSAIGVAPITVGDTVYYTTNQETSLTVHEYLLNEVTDTYTAFDVTSQVPNYIPTGAKIISGTGTSSILGIVSGSNRKHLYVYKFLNVDTKKVLSSWSLFTFTHDILDAVFNKDRLDLIFNYPRGYYYGFMDFDPTSKPSNHPFVPLLDCVVEKDFNATSGSVTLPFNATGSAASDFDVVSIDGSGKVTQLHTGNTKCTVTSLSSTAISASSNDGQPAKCYIGLKYDASVELSEVIMKVESSHGDTPTNVPYKIKNMSLYYTKVSGTEAKSDTSEIFELQVKAPRVGDFSNNTKTYGFDTSLDPSDGFFKVPVYLDGNDVQLKIVHESGYPVNFQNAEIEAITYARAKRY
jgi:hypothetical protein